MRVRIGGYEGEDRRLVFAEYKEWLGRAIQNFRIKSLWFTM